MQDEVRNYAMTFRVEMDNESEDPVINGCLQRMQNKIDLPKTKNVKKKREF